MEIYKVTNTVNGKVYIGQTRNDHQVRWNEHRYAAHYGTSNYFYNAIRLYGDESFIIELIDLAENQESLDELEKYWISFYKSTDEEFGYNCTEGGANGARTPEAIQRMSEAHKKLFEDPEFKERMRLANIGKHHTAEGRANISKAQKGKPTRRPGYTQSEYTKDKISLGLKKAFEEGRRTKTGGLKKGTVLGPMSEEDKIKRSEGTKLARRLYPERWAAKFKNPEALAKRIEEAKILRLELGIPEPELQIA